MASPLFYITIVERLKRVGPLVAIVGAAGLIGWFILWGPSGGGVDLDQVSLTDTESFAKRDAAYAAALALWDSRGDASRLEVRERMAALAPLASNDNEAMSHPEAHWWMVQDLRRQKSKGKPSRIRRHLERVIALDPSHEKACRSLTQLYLDYGRMDDALALLNRSVGQIPSLGLNLAQIHYSRGEEEAAQAEARRVADHAEQQTRQAPTDVVARMLWAQAEMLAGRHDRVMGVINDGRRRGDDPRYDEAEVSYLIWQSTQALHAEPPRVDQAWASVQQAGVIVPRHPQVIERVVALALRFPEAKERATALLHRLAAAEPSESTWAVHQALGTLAAQESDYQTAQEHFEKAHALQPGNLTVTNNLAWCLTQTKPAQLDRALALVTAVADDAQTDERVFSLLDTRGRVLINLGRHEEGVADLERALRFLEPHSQREAHRLLAEAYQALDLADLADNHRSLAAAHNPSEGQLTPAAHP